MLTFHRSHYWIILCFRTQMRSLFCVIEIRRVGYSPLRHMALCAEFSLVRTFRACHVALEAKIVILDVGSKSTSSECGTTSQRQHFLVHCWNFNSKRTMRLSVRVFLHF